MMCDTVIVVMSMYTTDDGVGLIKLISSQFTKKQLIL